ncbi:MAG TPA: MarR family transcriptional regulator [Ilumatobacteraceae bacterium]|jgi:DNA-binding MarR family transcriptional regulator
MAKPDPELLAVWRSFQTAHSSIDRALALALDEERQLPLAWFEALDALQVAGGKLRVMDLADQLVVSASSLSRQLNRMEEEGLVRRDRGRLNDQRAVVVVLTREGRDTWRRANTTYLRVVRRMFMARLGASDVSALQRTFAKVLDAS